MNYLEIRENCPKAFQMFIKLNVSYIMHGNMERIIIFNGAERLNDRDLYDFFENSNIIITFERFIKASYAVDNTGATLFKEDPLLTSYKNSIEAERAAFTKAFEILEERLTYFQNGTN